MHRQQSVEEPPDLVGLAGCTTLAEVHDTTGRSNVSITSAYLHVAVDEDGALGNLFKFD